jgi:hypothetical protein
MSADERRTLQSIAERVTAEAKTMFYNLSTNFSSTTKHTLEFIELYEAEVTRCTSVADNLVHSTTDFIAQCEQMDASLEQLEQLVSQAALMRKVAAELERKLDKVVR